MLKIHNKVRVIKDGKEVGKGIVQNLYYNRANEISFIGFLDETFIKVGLSIEEILPVKSEKLFIQLSN